MWQARLLMGTRAAMFSLNKRPLAAYASVLAIGIAVNIGAAQITACSQALENTDRIDSLTSVGEYNANDPIEDRHIIKELSKGDFLAAVFDGHGGWQAADFAQKRIAPVVQMELANSLAQTPDQISDALTRAFLRVEREFLYRVKFAFELGFGDVARTGACALVAMIRDDDLFIANAGDCRAVLARRSNRNGSLDAIALSNDHNAREPLEQAKLRALHPTEKDIIYCKQSSSCYVKGRLQPTRSLGDAYLKYSEYNAPLGQHRSAGRYIPTPYTPPYISTDPEVQHHSINREVDEFIVLASDGLWDYLSNEEVVSIVERSGGHDRNGASDCLIREVLERAAHHHNIEGGANSLRALPSGRARRVKHDDLTCIVVYLKKDTNATSLDTIKTLTSDASMP